MGVDITLILDDRSLQFWEYRTIQHLIDDREINVNVSLVVINREAEMKSSLQKALSSFRNISAWYCYIAVRSFRNALLRKPWYRRRIPLDELVDEKETEIIRCAPEPTKGFGNELPDPVVSKIADTDVAVRFGFGVLKGKVLEAPTYGVLSYHHGDISEYRGRPAGFYEFVHGRSMVGITLQRLSEELDAGTVVATTRCDIGEANSLQDVHHRQFSASPPLLTEGIKKLMRGDLPDQPDTLGTIYSTPTYRDLVSYLRVRLTRSLPY